MERTIYTIGHSEIRFSELAEMLRRHRVTTIVDVRAQPYSFHAPEFVKWELEERCRTEGFRYRWMGDHLGGRPHPNALLGHDDDEEAAADVSPGFHRALDLLIRLAAESPVALLGSEESHERCHRARLLAPALARRGHRVVHLRHDTADVLHQDALDLG
jgi:uncharacterized protein (DUF488 family)